MEGGNKMEVGNGNLERKKVGSWEGEKVGEMEVGSRTRRRPIGQDYAAAKDAEGGKKEGGKLGR